MIGSTPPIDLIHTITNQIKQKDIVLPVLPSVISKAFEVASNPESSAKDISQLIMTDQTLTVNILNMANSTYYFRGEKITSVHHAIAMLGFKTILNMIVSTVLHSQFRISGYYATLETNLWEHSLLTAFIAKDIAEKGRLDGEEAYLAGLIHDTGKTILLSMVNDAVQNSTEKQYPNLQKIENFLDKYHSYVGFIAAKKWQMSERICRAISLHHNMTWAKENDDLVALISLSNKLATICSNDTECENIEFEPLSDEMKLLNLSTNEMKKITSGFGKIQNAIAQLVM